MDTNATRKNGVLRINRSLGAIRVISVVLVTVLSTWASAGSEPIEAITRPSKDVALAFTMPGRIEQILVKEGNRVRAGDVLICQDDQAEQAQLAQLKAQAGDMIRVHAAQAQLDQKNVDYTNMQQAEKKGAATKMEVEHSRLDVVIAELSLSLAKFQRSQDSLKQTEVTIRVSRMKLISPINGMVEQIAMEVGESVDEQQDVIRIVDTDILWIDVPVPVAQAATLKPGRWATVVFAAARETQRTIVPRRTITQKHVMRLAPAKPVTVIGRIKHIASVADAASNTLRVRVEIPNLTHRPAGEHVRVSFISPKITKRAIRTIRKKPAVVKTSPAAVKPPPTGAKTAATKPAPSAKSKQPTHRDK